MIEYFRKAVKEHKAKLAIFVGAALLCFALCSHFSFKAACILSLGIVVIGLVNLPIRNRKALAFLYLLWAIMLSFSVCFLSTMICYETYFWSIGLRNIILSVSLVLCSVLALFLVTLRFRMSVIAITSVCMVLSTINHYVYMFRGNEFTPNDILSIGTAINVAAQYSMKLTSAIVYSWFVWLLFVLAGFTLNPLIIDNKISARKWLLIVEVLLCFGLATITRDITPQTYKQSGSLVNGYFLNLAVELRDMRVSKPNGYSVAAVNQVLDNCEPAKPTHHAKYPTIIVIMDESYTDFDIYSKKLQTNVPITPFIRSLSENAIRGYATASVFGGGTANSEYEFLTGNTLAFLPKGATVYQQYMMNYYSFVAELKNLGYKTVATHPYTANGWSRDRVYPKLGFDEMYFLEDYPQKDLMRGYVSDQEMFDYLIGLYEAKQSGERLFLFGITMQNHGGYDDETYNSEVKLSGLSGNYPDAEQFLSLINRTDTAFKDFVEYFKRVDEQVIVVFFGDHQPALDPAFYEELNGSKFDTLDEQMLQYKVPFIVWANYEIDEEVIEQTSMNYLLNYVYQVAGWDAPAYNLFLMETQKTIPAISAHGYYSAALERYVAINEASGDEATALNQYAILQYNNIFDEKHKHEAFSVSQ